MNDHPPPARYVYTTDTGEVAVYWPSMMSREDVDAVLEWFEVIKKKIARVPAAPARLQEVAERN